MYIFDTHKFKLNRFKVTSDFNLISMRLINQRSSSSVSHLNGAPYYVQQSTRSSPRPIPGANPIVDHSLDEHGCPRAVTYGKKPTEPCLSPVDPLKKPRSKLEEWFTRKMFEVGCILILFSFILSLKAIHSIKVSHEEKPAHGLESTPSTNLPFSRTH